MYVRMALKNPKLYTVGLVACPKLTCNFVGSCAKILHHAMNVNSHDM